MQATLPCPLCGQPTEPGDMRVADGASMCQSCAFQRALAATRNQAAAASASGTAGAAAATTESFLFGLVIGLVCGIFGLIWVHAAKRGPEMKRGVAVGFAVGFVLAVLVRGMMRVSRPEPAVE